MIDQATNRFVTTNQNFRYDKNGNLTTDGDGQTVVFNGENKQAEIKNASGQTIGRYLYDGEGKRVKKVTCSSSSVHPVVEKATGDSAPAVRRPSQASARTGPKATGTPGNVRFVPTYVEERIDDQYFGWRPGFYLASGDQLLTNDDLPDATWTDGRGGIYAITVDGINLLPSIAFTFAEANQNFALDAGTSVTVETGQDYVFYSRSDIVVINGNLVDPSSRTIVSTVIKRRQYIPDRRPGREI